MNSTTQQPLSLIDRGLVDEKIQFLWSSWQNSREFDSWKIIADCCITLPFQNKKSAPQLTHVGKSSLLERCTNHDWSYVVNHEAITPYEDLEDLLRHGFEGPIQGEPCLDVVDMKVTTNIGEVDVLNWRIILPIQISGVDRLVSLSREIRETKFRLDADLDAVPSSHLARYRQLSGQGIQCPLGHSIRDCLNL